MRVQTKSAFGVHASHMLVSALQSRLHPLEHFCQNRNSPIVASILQVQKNMPAQPRSLLFERSQVQGGAPKPWSHRQIGKCLAAMSHINAKPLTLNAKHSNFVVELKLESQTVVLDASCRNTNSQPPT